MQIIASCPECAGKVSLRADAADRRIRCPRCGRLLKVPKLEDMPEALRLIEQSTGTIYVDEEGRVYG
jgi:hypothetical protein